MGRIYFIFLAANGNIYYTPSAARPYLTRSLCPSLRVVVGLMLFS